MKNGAKDYLIKQSLSPESLRQIITSILKETYLENQILQNQIKQRLINNIALKIHESLELKDIINIAVQEIKDFWRS